MSTSTPLLGRMSELHVVCAFSIWSKHEPELGSGNRYVLMDNRRLGDHDAMGTVKQLLICKKESATKLVGPLLTTLTHMHIAGFKPAPSSSRCSTVSETSATSVLRPLPFVEHLDHFYVLKESWAIL